MAESCSAAGRTVDFRQADAMVSILEELAQGGQPVDRIQEVMGLPGTDLVVRQMNLARRVSKAQYRDVLEAVVRGKEPAIEPVDSTERARRGVQGLVRDVAGLLAWGRDHAPAIRAGLGTLETLPLAEGACAQALALLPERVTLEPRFAVVAGGRAGAAALSPADLYVDALISTRRAVDAGGDLLDPDGVQAFFAHELHHVGLRQIIASGTDSLSLDDPESFAFTVLTLLSLEGSATYLIDWKGDPDRGAEEPGFEELMSDPVDLLSAAQHILETVLAEPVVAQDRFDALTAEMVGNRYHATGALLVKEIDTSLGRQRLMRALRDPRDLVQAFNEATAVTGGTPAFVFDSDLARALAHIGEELGEAAQ